MPFNFCYSFYFSFCSAVQKADACVDMYTSDCPRITSLYARSLFMKLISEMKLSSLQCNTAESCGWGYGQQLKTLLTHQMQVLFGVNIPDMTSAKDMEAEAEYLCERRQSSLACLKNATHDLPIDVALVADNTLFQLENLFSYACGGRYIRYIFHNYFDRRYDRTNKS